MDKDLDARFERVEKALSTLIDSITKYNPSEKLAEDLVVADSELQAGLRELEKHQNNYTRIQQLRQETSALDGQIKDIMGTLWSVRKELKATQTTSYPTAGPKHPFTTAELLSYARRISRNTLPPPGVTNGIDFGASPTQEALPSQGESMPSQTPNASFNNGVGTPSASGEFMTSQATVSTVATELPQHLRPMLNLTEGAVFYPWPTEADIRGGALAAFQQIADRGIDPKGYDPDEEEQRKREEEQAKKDAEELARKKREEDERRHREEQERMARERARAQEADRRGSMAASSSAGAPKQFAFLDLDDDDEE